MSMDTAPATRNALVVKTMN